MLTKAAQKGVRIGVLIFITLVLFIGMYLFDATLGRVVGRGFAFVSMIFMAFTLAKVIMNKLIHDEHTGGLTFTRLFSLIK